MGAVFFFYTLCFVHSTLFYTLIVSLVFADAVPTTWDAISRDLIHPSTPNSNVTSMKAFFIDLRQKASLSPLLLEGTSPHLGNDFIPLCTAHSA